MSAIKFFAVDEEFGELSNFFLLKPPLVYRGRTYRTSEHLYQAMKFMYEGANEATLAHAERVRTARTPYMAKLLTKTRAEVHAQWPWQQRLLDQVDEAVASGARSDAQWQERKRDVMYEVLLAKFRGNAHCAAVLRATGDAVLEECSLHDAYWGTGRDGRGANWLGQLLMRVRDELAAEHEE